MVKLHTNNRLWAITSVCVFVALGFVNPVAGVAKGDLSLWAYVSDVVTGNFADVTSGVQAIVFLSLLLAVPAVLVGWVLQALIVLVASAFRPVPPDNRSTPNAGRVA